MELAWAKQMNAGNKTLNSEHKKLMVMVNDMERSIRARDGACLSQAFKLFEDDQALILLCV